MIDYENFERHLRGANLSENTIASYLFAVRQFSAQYGSAAQKNLRAYKAWLIDSYKPQTVKAPRSGAMATWRAAGIS